MKPVKHQTRNKDAKIYDGRSAAVHNLLFYVHTVKMHELRNQNVSYWLLPQY